MQHVEKRLHKLTRILYEKRMAVWVRISLYLSTLQCSLWPRACLISHAVVDGWPACVVEPRVQVVSSLGPGQYFGERALWKTNHPRAATAITQSPCTFYTLERAHFQRMLGPLDQIWRFEALKRVPIFFNLTDSQLLDLAAHLIPRTAAPNEVIIRQGEVGDSFYIIEEGTFTCYLDDGTKLALVDRGSCFGELALLQNEKRACNVAAERNGGMCFMLHVQLSELICSRCHKSKWKL
jgi:CRP-like cAMP-binding protein